MVCPTCGLDNDPSSPACARCNTTLIGASRAETTELSETTEPATSATPAAPVYGRSPRGPGRLPLFAAAAAVLLIAVVAAVIVVHQSDQPGAGTPAPPVPIVTQTGPTTPVETTTTGASAHDQAARVDAVLDQSIASRRRLNAAIDLVNRCTALSTALTRMRDVGAERQRQIETVGSADLSALPGGDRLRAALSDALRNALEADQAFVSWTAPTVSGGCANTTRRRTAYAQAQAASTRAQAAKKRFLAIWNPIALGQGLPQRSNTDI
jgi:hypothetical protein